MNDISASSTNCQRCGSVESCFLEQTLPVDALAEFRRSSRKLTLRRGEVLFREGDEPSGIWVICRGRLKIYRQGTESKPLITRISHAGELVGYRSFFANQPFMGSAEAMGEVVVIFLDRRQVEKFLERHGKFWALLLRKLSRDLGHAEAVAANMAYQCSHDRVFSVLSDLYHTEAWHDTVTKTKDLTIRRKDLAELSGLTVETTVRVLKEFERLGLIEIKGRQMRILDIERFEAFPANYCPE